MQSDAPQDSADALEEQPGSHSDDGGGGLDWTRRLSWRPRGDAPARRRPRSRSDYRSDPGQNLNSDQASSAVDNTSLERTFDPFHRVIAGASKCPRQTIKEADDKDMTSVLHDHGAVAVMLYHSEGPDPRANDIWPQCRSSAKAPTKYYLLDQNRQNAPDLKRRPLKNSEDKGLVSNRKQEVGALSAEAPVTRPKWKLPVELVELIATYLNRDDIKALRLVSRELNHNVSQVIFQTVVVPFNTEIYGMLGKEVKPDLKGKKRAMLETPSYSWKNANGDEVYNGHGLDVFRGFGRHIRRYGMSFEVNEDSLSAPPTKSLTEKKTSFWGRYEWPYEEYRRFDAVAGLETAADETPRMKTAFSELTKVKELALYIDSGLGWLSGPDKSIRARIFHRPSKVFGIDKAVPDRRAQAQQELWRHIQSCFHKAGSDIRHATLYKMDNQRSLSELEEARMLADVQPEIPYLDPQLIHEATPHDTIDIPMPTSFDDPYVLERFISAPSSLGTGVLFASATSPPDAGHVVNPIIPANLTKAQQEWLLETEWAQRAFLSSYMLSIIDNPTTFQQVHSLNISGFSDRYLPMLNRSDFWEALPNLCDVTLKVIPGWRTVHKDEAGFVATPLVNPVLGTNMLFALLRDHIACRSNIERLTVGWTTGGEHAEGLYARNKLLCPAPIMDLRIPSDRPASVNPAPLIEADAAFLRTLLLELPHIEKLRLSNCWITPSSLLQFVKVHDSHHLKELILDSVSLTAMLRPNVPNANGNFAPHQAAVPQNPPPMPIINQFLPGHHQILQVYIHTQQLQLQQLQANANAFQQHHIAALQTQLQQQLQQLQMHTTILMQNYPPQAQGQGPNQAPAPAPLQTSAQTQQNQPAHPNTILTNIGQIAAQVNQLHNQITLGQHNPVGQQPIHAPVPVNNPVTANAQSALRARPREGSWMDIIDQISPGTNLSDFESVYSKADNERVTSLQQIEFISCGYARLTHAPFDQTGIESAQGAAAASRHPWFTRRMAALSPAMMSAKWTYLADIIQEVDSSELAALDDGWNLRTGWDDSEEAHAVEFDSLLPGGTGRFTGIIRRSDRMADGAPGS
jgi:hypothetical protein